MAAAGDLRFYFYDYTAETRLHSGNDAVAQRLSDFLLDRPEIDEVYFFGAPRMGYYSIASLDFLVPEVRGIDMNAPWGSADNPRVAANEAVFVFLPEHREDLVGVRVAYPDGTLHEERTSAGTLVYWLYELNGKE